MDSRIVSFFIVLAAVLATFLHAREREPASPRRERPGRDLIVIERAKSPASRTRGPDRAPVLAPDAVVASTGPRDPCLWLKTALPGGPTTRAAANLSEIAGPLSAADRSLLNWLFEVPPVADAEITESPAQQFLRGLDEAGILLGRESSPRVDVPKAIATLEAAQSGDPGNGAFDLYLATLYQRQGRSAEALEAVRRGLAKDRFDVYMADVSKKLLAAPRDSVGFLQAVQLFSIMPVPDMNPVREALLSLTRSPEYATDVYRFAERIVDQAVGSRAPYNHLEWWLSTYVMASHVLGRRGQDIPRAFDLNQEFNLFPDMARLTDPEGRCDAREIGVAVHRYQETLGITPRTDARSTSLSRTPARPAPKAR